jgi:hypothetical protein
MSRTNHWPKDRAGVARHIHGLHPRQERTALLDWIDSLDASFGFIVTQYDGKTYLKAHDVTVEVDDTPAVIELLRLWAENELSPTPRNSLIRIDPDADMEAKAAKRRHVRKPLNSVVANLPQQTGKARDKAADLKEPLTDRDREILLYMLENGHDETGTVITQAELAEALTRGDHKNICNRLRAMKLVTGIRGRGVYLTSMGKQKAQQQKGGASKTD